MPLTKLWRGIPAIDLLQCTKRGLLFLPSAQGTWVYSFFMFRHICFYSMPRREIITVRGQYYVSRLPKYWPPPTPLSARRVCTPAFVGGGGGVQILEDERHRIALLQYNNLSTGAGFESRPGTLGSTLSQEKAMRVTKLLVNSAGLRTLYLYPNPACL